MGSWDGAFVADFPLPIPDSPLPTPELLKQELDQVAPFFVKRLVRWERFAGLAVPITRVRFVAFLTMQVSVEAGGRLRRDVLNDLVRGVPIAALVAPERGQIGRQSLGRSLLIQARFELVESHCGRMSKGETTANGKESASPPPLR
jgi:hypothetical protein